MSQVALPGSTTITSPGTKRCEETALQGGRGIGGVGGGGGGGQGELVTAYSLLGGGYMSNDRSGVMQNESRCVAQEAV